MSLALMTAAEGISVIACTPYILTGVYNNIGPAIRAAVARLRDAIAQAGMPIRPVTGADGHAAPDLRTRLTDGRALTLNNSRYFLLERPHHVLPPRLEDHVFGLQIAGFVPILTHPERLSWVDSHYDLVKRLVYSGVLLQLTAGSLLARFGRRRRYWAERMLDENLCHVLATRPRGIIENVGLNELPPLPHATGQAATRAKTASAWSSILKRVRRGG